MQEEQVRQVADRPPCADVLPERPPRVTVAREPLAEVLDHGLGWPLDRGAAFWIDRLFNGAFLEVLTEGRWSVPGLKRWTISEARSTLDFLGINFYGRQFIRWHLTPGRLPRACDLSHHGRDIPERTAMGWEVYPAAFTQALMRAAQLGLPILVTESGTWMEDDERRWQYLLRYIQAMAEAIAQGARVIGYLYWSLLDNFEWADGFAPRFGLVEVDYATQQRRIRESGRRYADICRANCVTL